MPLLAEKPFTAEEPVTDAPRPRKEDLLPQIAALALAGQSCRQIAATFGLPKSNVHRWLQDLREGCPQRLANSAEIIADAVDYYKSLYRQALESFDLSQADKVTERVVETQTARGPKKKRIVRTQTQAGKPAFLAAARRALDQIAKIAVRVAPRGKIERGKGRAPRTRGRGEGEKGRAPRTRGRGEGALKDESLKISKDDVRVLGAACSAESERREKSVAALQPESVVNSAEQTPQDLPEENGLREEKRLPEQRIAVGQVAAPHVDVGTSNERQPQVFARFSTGHARPVAESTYAIRSAARREKTKKDRNCPIPIAEARLGRGRTRPGISAAAAHRRQNVCAVLSGSG